MERCACSFLAAATTQARAVCSDRCSDHIAFPEPTAVDGSVGGHAATATSWPSDWPSSSIQCGIVRVHAATYGFATAAMLVPAVDEFDVATGRTTSQDS